MHSVKALFLLCLLGLVSFASAQKVQEPQNTNPDWSKPYKPFRIAGNLYYVGTYDLACYLIVSPAGNILINTGLASSAARIQENIESLGFKFKDLKILLTTQAHFDHMGAMAQIKKLTGAKMMVDEKDSAVVADGGSSDYALGGKGSTYQPLQPDVLLPDKDTIVLGNMKLIMLHHPGHTKGSCSFLFDVNDGQNTYRVLIANMPTIVTDKQFTELYTYPGIAKDYAYTFQSMKNLRFDIWLASHASQFNLHGKHKPGDPYNPKAFEGRKDYDTELADLEKQFSKKTANH
ncbi:MAG TPA: subclass B3 metallo-beta-lactamase [Bacteroidia bacterium]|jgi:metallo-beta-lactamase class B|nr:subclass B3 metallo-beta-lactamase [Bacteroidia bacterium]